MSICKLIDFKTLKDERGSLIALEQGQDIPFEIKRFYYIFNISKGFERGFHAHSNLKQMAIAVSGKCMFLIDNGIKKEEMYLDNPNKGLFIDGLIWREIKEFSEDCVLVVLANDHYKEKDYIRDYKEFIKKINLYNN